MKLEKLQKNWEEFAETDPLWAILTDPAKKGNKWKIKEFFKTGVEEINEVMRYVESLKISFPRKKALDFGCGVGRLTQALALYFDEICGVDIAFPMIELAKKFNKHGDTCKYYLNKTDDLSMFDDNSFDFIYSNLVLQHMRSRYSKNYIKEFLRVLSTNGALIFQQPSREIPPDNTAKVKVKLKEFIRSVIPDIWVDLYRNKMQGEKGGNASMEMYEIRRKDVVSLIEENGGKVLDIVQDDSWGSTWVNFRYCVTKSFQNDHID